MGIVGAFFGAIVALVLIGPAYLLAVTLPPIPAVGTVLVGLTSGFLTFYVAAVISGYVFQFLLWAFSALTASRSVRHVVFWFLSLVYVVVTLAFLPIVTPIVSTVIAIVVPHTHAAGLLALFAFAPLHFVLTLLVYLMADGAAPAPGSPGGTGNLGETGWRGFLVGINAVVNFLLTAFVVAILAEPFLQSAAVPVGIVLGFVLALVVVAASVLPTGIAPLDTVLRFVVGWTAWLLPSAWPTVFLGWILMWLNCLGNVLLGHRASSLWGLFAIDYGVVMLGTGMTITEGGISANTRFDGRTFTADNAYNLGAFAFQHARTTGGWTGSTLTAGSAPFMAGAGYNTWDHEGGHNLNLAAFGTWFHVINAVDQNLLPFNRGVDAYAERLAESNRQQQASWIPFWR